MKHLLLVVLLAGLGMLGAFSTDTYLPSFNAISKDFGVELPLVQLTLTVYLMAMSFMTLFHGSLSDVFGRKPVILWGLVVYAAASLGAAFAPNFSTLLICRLFQGLSVGVGMVVGRAILRDIFSGAEAHRIMSYVTLVFGLAPVVAPILGGWLQVKFGWHSVFVFLFMLGLILFLLCRIKLKESLPVERRAPFHLGKISADYWRIICNRKFTMQSLSAALSSSALFIYISSAPAFIMRILHLPETAFAWLFAPMITGIMAGAFISGRLAHKWAPQRIIWCGYGMMVLAASLNVLYSLFLTPAVPGAVIPIMLCTFGMSFIAPPMSIITLDLYPERRGLAASMQSAFMMGMFALFSGVIAPLLFDSALKLSCGVFVGYVVSALLWWGWGEGNSPTPEAEESYDGEEIIG